MGCENPQNPTDAAVCEALNQEVINDAVRQALAYETNENMAQLREAIEKNEISKSQIGIQEWEFFLQYFSLTEDDPVQVFNKVKSIHPKGIIGPITLRKLYLDYYPQDLDSLPFFQRNRYNIYLDLENYRPDRGRTPISTPNPFSGLKYFGGDGEGIFQNIPHTFIASQLQGMIPSSDTPNTLFIERMGGKNILRFYNGSGVLEIATYVSGGTNNHRSPENFHGQTSRTDRFHVSASYPEDGDKGASMFAATHIQGGVVWVHGSNDAIDGYDHSHGCFRAGLYYADALQRYVDRNGGINIRIGNLY